MAGLDMFYGDENGRNMDSREREQLHLAAAAGDNKGFYRQHTERREIHSLIDDPDFRHEFHKSLTPSKGRNGSEKDASVEDGYVAVGMGVSALVIENVLCHPLIVLRRTCQVSPAQSARFHCVPFQILPVSIHLYQWQGVSAFYKGLGGCLTMKGLQMGAEDLTSKLTPWPKELDRGGRMSLKRIGQHLLLKATSIAVTTPFYSASLVETVQSDIACEKPGTLDIFREGLHRIVPSYSGARLLPVWLLLPPTVLYGVGHYAITSVVGTVASKLMAARRKRSQERNGGAYKKSDSSIEGASEQTANAVGHLIADVMLYPVETVLNRLHLQGSRTIIDDLDTGLAVVPVLSRYEGVIDCFETIRAEEGICGFYRGFGALILQYAIRLAALHACGLVARELVSSLLSADSPPPYFSPSQQVQSQSSATSSAHSLDHSIGAARKTE